MLAELRLDRFKKPGILLERRRQPCRSFVENFISLLYVVMAQQNHDITDVFGNSRTVGYNIEENLRLVSPPGYGVFHDFPGDFLGIQVGSGTTLPTPTDYKMQNRLPHVDQATEASNVMFEGWAYAPATGSFEVFGSNWRAMLFLVSEACRVYAIRLRVYREGDLTGMTLTISIKNVDGSDLPTGPDLASGTLTNLNTITSDSLGEWVEIILSSQTTVVPLTKYAIVVRLSAGDYSNNIHWRYYSHSDASYRRYRYPVMLGSPSSGDGGSSWTFPSYSRYTAGEFKIMGRHPQGLHYGGSGTRELIEPTPPPDMQFTIMRYFTNLAGSAVTVNEVGIHALGRYSSANYVFLIARDVVSPGIEVANNEILRVTYVPQISV